MYIFLCSFVFGLWCEWERNDTRRRYDSPRTIPLVFLCAWCAQSNGPRWVQTARTSWLMKIRRTDVPSSTQTILN